MVWTIIGAVATLVVMGIWMFKGGSKIHAEHLKRFEDGLVGTASIRRSEQMGGVSRANGTAVWRLHVLVSPADGEPYAAVTGVRTRDVHASRAQAGEQIAVRIARDNPAWVYPDVPWGEIELLTIARPQKRR